MIQRYIKNQLADVIELEWTVDYKTSNGNYGAVYYDGGDRPDLDDRRGRHMNYQVVVEHEDFKQAEQIAYEVYDLVHDTRAVQTSHFDRPIFVQYIFAENEPMRIGVHDDKMIYTINFNALIYPDCSI